MDSGSPLQVLDLSGNMLTGTVPSSIGGLQLLQVLSLQHNRFNGSVPDALGCLFHLR